jgi:glycosyltransferase involved in cell wall biosynthesis
MNKKICIICDVFSHSGYSIHGRNLAETLNDLGYEVSIDCQKALGWELGCPEKLFNILKREISNEVVIMVGLPPFWSLKLMDKPKHFIGFFVWEGDKIPEHYLEHMNKKGISQIWCPSQHTKDAILNTGNVSAPIHIIPEGVNTEIFKKIEQPKDSRYTFLYNKGWTQSTNDRGGVQYLLKAFAEEFKKEENAALIIKINMAYAHPGWNLHNELNKLGIDFQRAPPVTFALDSVNYPDLPRMVYNKADCYVAPTRAEAFGLTIAEAMACELPVITTNYGAQTEFKECVFVDYKLEPAKDLMYEEVNWATPDIEDLKKKMRYAFEHKEELKELGKRGREYMVNNFTWKHCGIKAKEALEKL